MRKPKAGLPTRSTRTASSPTAASDRTARAMVNPTNQYTGRVLVASSIPER